MGVDYMKTVAVLMERVPLTDWGFMFNPIDIIIGVVDNVDNILVTDQQTCYFNMNDFIIAAADERLCYGFEIPIDELKAMYPKQEWEESLRGYLDHITQYCHLGFYSYATGEIEIVHIPLENIENLNNNKTLIVDNEDLSIVVFTREVVESMLLDLAANKKDDVISLLEGVKKELVKIDQEQTSSATNNVSNDPINQKTDVDTPVVSVSTLLPEETASVNDIDVDDLYQKVTAIIKSQDDQVQEIVTTIAMNYLNKDCRNSHILISGPTGTGKTEIVNLISKYINVPMISYDMTQVSVVGYVGMSIDDILIRLYKASNNDLNQAENGILVLDEIDKKASHGNYDVSGRGVLNSLLKVLDGTVFDLNLGKAGVVSFDTSKLTVVAMGAFSNMKLYRSNPIGFKSISNNPLVDIDADDYVKYGIPEEFLGRFTTLVTLNPLTQDNLKEILLTSSLSPLITKRDTLGKLGIQVDYSDDFIEAVAKTAMSMKTGARALQSIIEYSFKRAEFEIVRARKYGQLKVDERTVYNNRSYVLK